MSAAERSGLGVGPVLHATPFAAVVVAAIEAENNDVVVHDEGASSRCGSSKRQQVGLRSALTAAAGHEVRLPGDLEVIMSSFTGLVRMSESGALSWLATEPVPDPFATNAGRLYARRPTTWPENLHPDRPQAQAGAFPPSTRW